MIFNLIGAGGGGMNKFPEFTYTGTYELIDDGMTEDKVQNWRIKFLTSGTLTFAKLKTYIDAFVVGGGAAGGGRQGGGGGGGYTKSLGNLTFEENTPYTITVGAGGTKASTYHAKGNDGGASSIKRDSTIMISADGGKGGYDHTYDNRAGGNGGSGGGAGSTEWGAGDGGTNGGNGANQGDGSSTGGLGQGTSTYEFWELDRKTSVTLYAGGGGGGGSAELSSSVGGAGGGGNGGATSAPTKGTENLGGGGGGGNWSSTSLAYGAAGGAGIVIIRNARTGSEVS